MTQNVVTYVVVSLEYYRAVTWTYLYCGRYRKTSACTMFIISHNSIGRSAIKCWSCGDSFFTTICCYWTA